MLSYLVLNNKISILKKLTFSAAKNELLIVAGLIVEELAKKLKARFNITIVAKNERQLCWND